MSRTAAKADAALPLTVAEFASTPSVAIPVAGLLAARPELAGQSLPADEWAAHLDSYLATERS